LLEHYEHVSPGAADRILTQFEEQGRHRRVLERRVVTHNMVSATIGQIAAFLLFLVVVGAGVFLLNQDKEVGGLGTLITAVGGAAWVLRKAENARKRELAQKREDGGRK
jgi:hypothetical protein